MSKEKSEDVLMGSIDEIETKEIDRAEGMYIEWLVGEESEADCYMRRFTMEKNGKMPLHKHDNLEHVQYVLKGKIEIIIEDKKQEVETGSFIYIPEDTPHSYKNINENESQFLCIIPAIEDRHTEILND